MFEPGNKLAKGGARQGAGRPSKAALGALAIQRAKIEGRLAKDADSIYDLWRKWQAEDAATCRHAMDKILGDGDQTQIGTVNIAIGQFEGHQPSTELRQDGIAIRIGGGNGQNSNGDGGS